MRFRFRPLLMLAPMIAILAGCVSVRVDTDYDPTANFDAYRTYQWMEAQPTGDPRIDNQLLRKRVRSAVDAVMASRGYRADVTAPDFHIIEHYMIERQVDVDTYVRSYGYGYGYGAGWGPASVETSVREYDEGTVIFDIIDGQSMQLVWRGSGAARIRERLSPEERAERVRQIVARVFQSFPPGDASR